MKVQSSLAFLLMLLLIPAITFAENQADTINHKLEEADNKRSSDIKRFSTILGELKEQQTSFNQDQTEYFGYLTAYQLSLSGNLDEALKKYQAIIGSTKNNKMKYRSLSSVLNTYAVKRDAYHGTKTIRELIELKPQINDSDLINQSLIVIAIFYNQLENYALGKQYSIEVLSNHPIAKHECLARQTLINAEYNLKLLNGDLVYVDESLAVCQSINEVVVSGLIIGLKSRFLLDANRPDDAKQVIDENASNILNTNYPPLMADYYSIEAELAYRLKDNQKAKEFLEKAIEFGSKIGNSKPIVRSYKLLADISEGEKKFEESLAYFKRYAETNSAYLNEINSREMAVQQAMLETLEKENQISLLDKENTLLKTQADLVDKQTQNERLALALVSLLLLMLIIWAYRNRRFQLQFRRMAQTDDLTGIANRHHFSEQAQNNLNFCRKSQQPLSFIIFDLDYFKNINDNFGHQIGDWAIKAAVKAAHFQCRKNDIIGRIGGEEFAILLPGCDVEKAMKLAESCRNAIATISSKETGKKFQITASFGVADTQSYGYNFDKLFAAADDALYQSKDSGRNKVYCNKKSEGTDK